MQAGDTRQPWKRKLWVGRVAGRGSALIVNCYIYVTLIDLQQRGGVYVSPGCCRCRNKPLPGCTCRCDAILDPCRHKGTIPKARPLRDARTS